MKLSVPKLLVLAAAMAALTSAASPSPNEMGWEALQSQLQTRAGDAEQANSRLSAARKEVSMHEAYTTVATQMTNIFGHVQNDVGKGETVANILPKITGAVSEAAGSFKEAISNMPNCPEGVQALVADLKGLEDAYNAVSEHWNDYYRHLSSPEFEEARSDFTEAKAEEERLEYELTEARARLQDAQRQLEALQSERDWVTAALEAYTFLNEEAARNALIQAIDDNDQLSEEQQKAAWGAVKSRTASPDVDYERIYQALTSNTPGSYKPDLVKQRIAEFVADGNQRLVEASENIQRNITELNNRVERDGGTIPRLTTALEDAKARLSAAEERSKEFGEENEAHQMEVEAEFKEFLDRLREEKELFAAFDEKCQSPAVKEVIDQTPNLYEPFHYLEGTRDVYLAFADGAEHQNYEAPSAALQERLAEIKGSKTTPPRNRNEIEAEIEDTDRTLQRVQSELQELAEESTSRHANVAAAAAAAGL